MAPPAEIVDDSFIPLRDLEAEELESLAVDGSNAAFREQLESGSWTGSSYAAIAVHLFADNSRIEAVSLLLGGKLDGTWTAAPRCWPTLPGTFKFKPTLDLASFTFVPGTLHTELLDARDEHLTIVNGDTAITLETLKRAGGSDLCFRLVCYPTNHKYMHVNCLVYPMSAAALSAAHPASDAPHFPGILCITKDVILNPAADDDVRWGSPWFPLLVKGNKEASLENVSCFDIRSKMSKFLRSAVKSLSCMTISQLQVKWASFGQDGEPAPAPLPDKLWPLALDLMPSSASLISSGDRQETVEGKPGFLPIKSANLNLGETVGIFLSVFSL